MGQRAGHGKGRGHDRPSGDDLGRARLSEPRTTASLFMSPLPEAEAATPAFFIAWLERFSGYVREVDYAAARPLFHPDILAFGTHRDIISGLAKIGRAQV